MKQIRIDAYGGYVDQKTPDTDMRFTWRQYLDETAQDFLERVIANVTVMVEELAEVEDEDDE